MRYFLILFFLLIVLDSCKEETSYEMQLLIENKTENTISVRLYPKNKFLHNELYNSSDFGGGYSNTEFEIDANQDHSLFYSQNIDQEPYNLASQIFDSIHIKSFNSDKISIKYSVDTVIGYSENLFDSSSTWNYEIINTGRPDNFNQNPVELHNYTFVISGEKTEDRQLLR